MESFSGRALDSKQIHEQLHDDLDFSVNLVRIQTLIYLIVLTLMPKYVGLI
jgi:hypothetical protein